MGQRVETNRLKNALAENCEGRSCLPNDCCLAIYHNPRYPKGCGGPTFTGLGYDGLMERYNYLIKHKNEQGNTIDCRRRSGCQYLDEDH